MHAQSTPNLSHPDFVYSWKTPCPKSHLHTAGGIDAWTLALGYCYTWSGSCLINQHFISSYDQSQTTDQALYNIHSLQFLQTAIYHLNEKLLVLPWHDEQKKLFQNKIKYLLYFYFLLYYYVIHVFLHHCKYFDIFCELLVLILLFFPL